MDENFAYESLFFDCIQCGEDFELTGSEVQRFMSKGFDLPRRCPDCRKNKSKIVSEDHFCKNHKRYKKPYNEERDWQW